MNSIKEKWSKERKQEIYVLAFLVFCTSIYATFISLRTMPMAEGWYSYYAKCVLNGEHVYSDFEYLFTPIYLYLITGIISVFGYNIFVLRIVGVIFWCVFTLIIYKIFAQIYSIRTAGIISLVAVFYGQSVNVNVFYDYIKLMDIFCALAMLFMVIWVGKTLKSAPHCRGDILWWATFCALFIMTKQNMGLIFWFYSNVVIFGLLLIKKISKKKAIYSVLFFNSINALWGLGLAIILIANGSFSNFMRAILGGAAEAKGGLIVILFGWLKNGRVGLQKYFFISLILAFILIVLKFFPIYNVKKMKYINFVLVVQAIILIVVMSICMNNSKVGTFFAELYKINPYLIFEQCFIYMIFLMAILYIGVHKKYNLNNNVIITLVLLGGFFAISYGTGTSGGLSVSESVLGIAVLMGELLDWTERRGDTWYFAILSSIGVCCLLNSASYKMVYPYYWWGQDTCSIYDCTEESIIPELKGILLSEETKKLYDGIYSAIMENVEQTESIYCFPQIPIFYVLCQREDPGVFSKVQWFDVTTKNAIQQDIEILKKNSPKAIIMYNVEDFAYQSHESLFRNGEISATKEMREFLYNYIFENGYSLYDIYSSDNNSILIYFKDYNNLTKRGLDGMGTVDNPFLIRNKEDFLLFVREVNEGRSFANQYIKQMNDIDLENETISPIGIFDSQKYFYGCYDGNGYVIKNFSILSQDDSYNNGLFGMLGGCVANLGVIDADIYGDCCGVIASHSIGENASIINCFTDATVEANSRAGGIADNFYGIIYNCFSFGDTKSIYSSCLISYGYSNEKLVNTIVNNDGLYSLIIGNEYNGSEYNGIQYNDGVVHAKKEYFKSQVFVNTLNNYVDQYYEEDGIKIQLKNWEIEDGMDYPVLVWE